MKFRLIIITLILLINVGFSFGLLLSTFYQNENSDSSKFSTINGIFSGNIKRSDMDFQKILELLKHDNDIENKYIMGFDSAYSFYTNAKFIFTDFTEGSENDSILDFITRKNWSSFDHWLSSTNSIPPKKDTSYQTPDYLIYHFSNTVIDPASTWHDKQLFYIHSLLADPNDPNVPEFLNPIYFANSSKGGIVVYEVSLHE